MNQSIHTQPTTKTIQILQKYTLTIFMKICTKPVHKYHIEYITIQRSIGQHCQHISRLPNRLLKLNNSVSTTEKT